jgi:succinate-semialdehyde dehydrogenase/glutarate-semialdehyde dehydrogenase
MGDLELEACISRAVGAARGWSEMGAAARAGQMRAVAAVIRERLSELASLITTEMGRPLRESRAELSRCAAACEYYAENGQAVLAPVEEASAAPRESYVRWEPFGVVLGIMPWNLPFFQVFRFALPALVAGNTVLLKHAPNVTRCAVALSDVFRSAGLPEGAFQALRLEVARVADVIADSRVGLVVFTGSARTGRLIGSLCGRHLKKVILELGGSDPFIVLDESNLDAAARAAVTSRFMNAGQTCLAAKRLILTEAVADPFEERFLALVRALRVGDPRNEDTDVGPLARKDVLETLEAQVEQTLAQGARCAVGGRRVGEVGFFHAPTVLTHCAPGMVACQEETFGPVAAILRVRDAAEALAVANASAYGLSASVWTQDEAMAARFIEKLESGSVYVNAMTQSDLRLPFGGTKASGYGRDFGKVGIREFTQSKTVWRA